MQRAGATRRVIFIVSLILTIILAVVIDQVTKYYVRTTFSKGEGVNIIDGFFYFVYRGNTGSGFSFLAGVSWAQTFFKIFTVFALLIFVLGLIFAVKRSYKFCSVGISIAIGGAIGNFVDRLLFSEVTDFIGFTFGSYNFAIFNMADTYLTVGVIMIIIHYLFLDKDAIFKKKNGKEDCNGK